MGGTRIGALSLFGEIDCLAVGADWYKSPLPWTIIFFPFVLLPLIFASLGIAWFRQHWGFLCGILGKSPPVLPPCFCSFPAVFYPLSALPVGYQGFLRLKPLVLIIIESRKVLVFGNPPDRYALGIALLVGFAIATVGFGGFKERVKDLQMSSNDYAIKVEYLSKRYQIYARPEDRLKQSIIPRMQALVGRSPKNLFPRILGTSGCFL